jgi:hypothetical protein
MDIEDDLSFCHVTLGILLGWVAYGNGIAKFLLDGDIIKRLASCGGVTLISGLDFAAGEDNKTCGDGMDMH